MPDGFSSGRLETGPGPFLYTRVVEIKSLWYIQVISGKLLKHIKILNSNTKKNYLVFFSALNIR